MSDGKDPNITDPGLTQPLVEHEVELNYWGRVKEESSRILTLALPLAAQAMCSYGLTFVNVLFVGRLGAMALSVCVLASSVYNVSGLSVLVGLNTAMDTLCGQAYGAGNYEKVGIIMQRAVMISLIGYVVVCGVYTQMEHILLFLGQEATLAKASAEYLQILVIGLAFAVGFDVMKRYLIAQSTVAPSMFCTAFATCLSPLYNWLFIYKLKLGLYGAAWSYTAAMVTMFVLKLIYIIARDIKLKGDGRQTFDGWSKRCFTNWGQYMSLAVPAVIMVCLEWWTSEVIIIMAGWLPNAEVSVAVIGVLVQLLYLLGMLALGLSTGTSIRVANMLGASNGKGARIAWQVGLGTVIIIEVIICSVVVTTRNSLGYMFSSDAAVVAGCAVAFPVCALAMFADSTQCVQAGVLRGSGNQKIGAILNVFDYWVIGVPSAYIFCFPLKMGVPGLIGGFALASWVQVVALVTIVYRLDFDKEAVKALVRINAASVTLQQREAEEFRDELDLLKQTAVRTGSVAAPLNMLANVQNSISIP